MIDRGTVQRALFALVFVLMLSSSSSNATSPSRARIGSTSASSPSSAPVLTDTYDRIDCEIERCQYFLVS